MVTRLKLALPLARPLNFSTGRNGQTHFSILKKTSQAANNVGWHPFRGFNESEKVTTSAPFTGWQKAFRYIPVCLQEPETVTSVLANDDDDWCNRLGVRDAFRQRSRHRPRRGLPNTLPRLFHRFFVSQIVGY